MSPDVRRLTSTRGHGHFIPTEARGFADALAAASDGTPAAPRPESIAMPRTSVAETDGDSDPYEDSADSTGPRSPIMHFGRRRKKDA